MENDKGTAKNRTLVFSAACVLLLTMASCNSLPPGTPPAGAILVNEPTILQPPRRSPQPETTTTAKTATPKVQESAEEKGLNATGAVNAMTTSLATRCLPIAAGGSPPPLFANRLLASGKDVDNLQMEVWRRLVRMGLVTSAGALGKKAEYEIVGKIKQLPFRGGSGKRYSWNAKVLSVSTGKTVWNETIEFSTKR